MSKCDIESCENDSERTLSKDRISQALIEENLKLIIKKNVTKAKICKPHYRKLKKHLKKADKLERARWD